MSREVALSLLNEVTSNCSAETEYARCAELGISLLFGDGIPAALRPIPWPPRLLYCRGEISELERCVGIVGSRRALPLSRRNAFKLGKELAQAGITVVSGLARGVDGAALEGALQAGVPVVAVLGNGLPSIYPKEHEGLATRIVSNGGAVISECPLDAPPRRQHFPRRNRLISGLAEGVVVVQATERSGSLITVGWALEQGKDVFAFPGPTDGPHFEGCHRLIREGAVLVTGARQVLEGLEFHGPVGSMDPLFVTELRRQATSANVAKNPDELIERTGLPPSTALRGWVGRSDPANDAGIVD